MSLIILTFICSSPSDIGDKEIELLPWFKNMRPLISGDVFSDFLGTTGDSAMFVLNSRKHSVQCSYKELRSPAVVAYARLNVS